MPFNGLGGDDWRIGVRAVESEVRAFRRLDTYDWKQRFCFHQNIPWRAGFWDLASFAEDSLHVSKTALGNSQSDLPLIDRRS
jgi:hypothetical protein